MEFESKLSELGDRVNDFIIARNVEKDEMLGAISRGENIQLGGSTMNNQNNYGGNTNNQNSYLNPAFNVITNLKYSYQFHK